MKKPRPSPHAPHSAHPTHLSASSPASPSPGSHASTPPSPTQYSAARQNARENADRLHAFLKTSLDVGSAQSYSADSAATQPAPASEGGTLSRPLPAEALAKEGASAAPPETPSSKPDTPSSSASSATPPWAHALAALEATHARHLRTALAASDESHRQSLAALEARLASAEQTTAELASQLRELR